MRQTKKFKAFTLIEMLIVMVIIWILSVVLIEAYLTISKTALRVEQEKNLSEESLILTQVFQAISDEATIDYDAYSGNSIKLTDNWWFTNILYLTWGNWSWTSIYTTWENCLELEWNFPANDDDSYPDYSEKIIDAAECQLVMEQNGEITPLTAQWKVVISKAMFRIIPYDSDKNYFSDTNEWKIITNDIHQPAFWFFAHLYAPLYQPTWTNKIDLPLQLFFNLQYIKSWEDLY